MQCYSSSRKPNGPTPSSGAPAVLTNDLKALMTQAERLLQRLHAPIKAAASAAGGRQAPASPRVAASRPPQAAPAAEPSSSPQGSALLRPFAVVDEVAQGSPAGEAGIAVGDQMLRFAGVQAQPSALQAVAAALQVEVLIWCPQCTWWMHCLMPDTGPNDAWVCCCRATKCCI